MGRVVSVLFEVWCYRRLTPPNLEKNPILGGFFGQNLKKS